MRRADLALITLLLLLAACLRLYQLNTLPPGWRDDEVVETTVHAQLVLDGNYFIFFPQAEGHEPLYHYLSALMIALGGRSLFTVRLLSVFFSLLSLAALYRLARRHFGARVALIALAVLAVSFWGLMYARFKLRHISTLAPMLLAFDFFLRANRRRLWAAAGFFLALTLYTYFAARSAPLILLAFAVYLALFHRTEWRTQGRGWLLAAGVAGALTLPLAWAVLSTPGGEARLSVVGQPLQELLRGQPAYALRNTIETLGMITFTGDPEFLYNIPHRPVFDWLGAALFAAGVLVCLWRWRKPAYAFLLIWLLGGLAPAFVSIPSASLGHTIAALPVVYLFPAIALATLPRFLNLESWNLNLARAIALLFLFLTALRDGRDYFAVWPALPEVRDLYRAELHTAAQTLRAQALSGPLALASRNLHQADVAALKLDAPQVEPRLFNPEGAWLFPQAAVPVLLRETANAGEAFGQAPLTQAFALRSSRLPSGAQPEVSLSETFANGWVCEGFIMSRSAESPPTLTLTVYWRLTEAFTPPAPRPIETLSGSSIPLKIFSHVLSGSGEVLAGDDRLDVDPSTLRPGDTFAQRLQLAQPPGAAVLQIGLYNPVSGQRVPLANGAEVLTLMRWTP